MPKQPVLKARKLVKVLLTKGFYVHHQTGSHINLRHEHKVHLHVVIPFHNRELAPKTLKSILIQSELTFSDIV
jgi:predicted RNA binding protein YcfA (HicA-like mRNA interferase family)